MASKKSLYSVTPTSSTTHLVKPQLYTLYGGESSILSETQDTSSNIYSNLPSEISKVPTAKTLDSNSSNLRKLSISSVLLTILNLSIFGNAFILLFQHVHQSNALLPNPPAFIFITTVSVSSLALNTFLNNTLNAFALYFISTILSYILGSICPSLSASRITVPLHDNTIPTTIKSSAFYFVDPYISLIGLAYSLKKLPWSSKLQAALLFSLANLFICSYLDCTILDFVVACTIACFSMTLSLNNSKDYPFSNLDISGEMVWIGAVIFLSVLIVRKIGLSG